jgi:hypothetical protein
VTGDDDVAFPGQVTGTLVAAGRVEGSSGI